MHHINKRKKTPMALMRKRTSRPTQQAEKRAFKDFSRQLVGRWNADAEIIAAQELERRVRTRW